MMSAKPEAVLAAAVILIPVGSVALALTSLRSPRDIRGRLNILPNEPRTEKDLRSEAFSAGLASFGYITLVFGLMIQVQHTLMSEPIDADGWWKGGLSALVLIVFGVAHAWETYWKTLNAFTEDDETPE